jgi:signal transduction protein with GAF and PtsI domain
MIFSNNRVITHYGVKGQQWGVRRKRSTSTSSGKTGKGVAGAKKRREQTKKHLKQLSADVKKKKNWSDARKKKEINALKAVFKSDLKATPASMKKERREIIKTLVAGTLLIIS